MRYIATLDGEQFEVEIEELAGNSRRVSLNGQQFEVSLERVGMSSYSALVGERCFDFDLSRDGAEVVVVSRQGSSRVTLIDRSRRALAALSRPEASGRAEIKAVMPGRIVNILAPAGSEVQAGDGVLVVEAMKMENEIKAPKSGKIAEVKVAAGQTVEKGELLAVIE